MIIRAGTRGAPGGNRVNTSSPSAMAMDNFLGIKYFLIIGSTASLNHFKTPLSLITLDHSKPPTTLRCLRLSFTAFSATLQSDSWNVLSILI